MEEVAEYIAGDQTTADVSQNGVPKGWQDDFRLKKPILQKDVAAWERAFYSLPLPVIAAAARRNNLTFANNLKAAIEAGWVEHPETSVGTFTENTPDANEGAPSTRQVKRFFYNGMDVEEMQPGMVRWLGFEVEQAYNRAIEIPPN